MHYFEGAYLNSCFVLWDCNMAGALIAEILWGFFRSCGRRMAGSRWSLFQVMDIVQSHCSLGTGNAHFHNKCSIYQRHFPCPDVKNPILTVSEAWQSTTAIQLGGVVQFHARPAVTSGLYAKCTALWVAANQTAELQCWSLLVLQMPFS